MVQRRTGRHEPRHGVHERDVVTERRRDRVLERPGLLCPSSEVLVVAEARVVQSARLRDGRRELVVVAVARRRGEVDALRRVVLDDGLRTVPVRSHVLLSDLFVREMLVLDARKRRCARTCFAFKYFPYCAFPGVDMSMSALCSPETSLLLSAMRKFSGVAPCASPMFAHPLGTSARDSCGTYAALALSAPPSLATSALMPSLPLTPDEGAMGVHEIVA
jgi:hypothetical protein